MAGKAVFRKDGANVPVEIDGAFACRAGGQRCHQPKQQSGRPYSSELSHHTSYGNGFEDAGRSDRAVSKATCRFRIIESHTTLSFQPFVEWIIDDKSRPPNIQIRCDDSEAWRILMLP